MRGGVRNTQHDRSERTSHSDILIGSADYDQSQICRIDALCGK
jgi:hypothetical protein